MRNLLERFNWWLGLVVPLILALALAALAIAPLVQSPDARLVPMVAGVLGGLLSFAAVCFSASRSIPYDDDHAREMAVAGHVLLRAAIPTAAALAIAMARIHFLGLLGPETGFDKILRTLLSGLLGSSVGLSFFAAEQMVAYLSPSRIAKRIDAGRSIESRRTKP